MLRLNFRIISNSWLAMATGIDFYLLKYGDPRDYNDFAFVKFVLSLYHIFATRL